ncbi:hypothetical protein [Paramixta manurensis]|uniref:hypothetical protein n=1 Tax=Paramixta manurensis TaxID=2740817 RepID=UPI00156BA30C
MKTQKKGRAILLTIDVRGLTDNQGRAIAAALKQGVEMGFHGATDEKYPLKNSDAAINLACCTDFGCFTLTIGCAFAKTL